MGYEIGFLVPGQDDDGLVDELPPLELTDKQEAAWRRIVLRTRQEIGAAEEDRYPTHFELWLKDPAMQLWYEGGSASIEVPYWYTATAASAHGAIATAYALARIVEAETGMPGVDYEVDQGVQDDGLPRAVARYRGVGQHVRALVERETPPRFSSNPQAARLTAFRYGAAHAQGVSAAGAFQPDRVDWQRRSDAGRDWRGRR